MEKILGNNITARTLACSAAVLLAAMASGCSNNDDDEGGGGGGGGVTLGDADLSTAEGVKTQVGTLGSLLGAISTLDSLSDVGTIDQRAKVGSACPDGGEFQDVAAASKNVNSPFTTQAINVSGERAVDCKFVDSSSGGGVDVDYTVVFNGLNEGGSIEDNGSVLYARIGESDAAPFELDYKINTSGSTGGQSFSSDTDLNFGISYRLDAKNSNAGDDHRVVLKLAGDYDVSASSGGQSGSASGDIDSFVGKSDAPFKVVSDSTGINISGAYGFGISPAPAGATCTSAEVSVETTDPLFAGGSGGSPYSAGTIKMTSGSSSATVTFNDDGTVTVTPQGGAATTIDYAEAVASAAPCVGFAFAGLYFAAGAL